MFMPLMLISKVYTQIEPKVFVPWNINPVNGASTSIKKIFKTIVQKCFFLRRYDKKCVRSVNCHSYETHCI